MDLDYFLIAAMGLLALAYLALFLLGPTGWRPVLQWVFGASFVSLATVLVVGMMKAGA